jgi:hypothetical protein
MLFDASTMETWPVYITRRVQAPMDEVFRVLIGKDYDLGFSASLRDHGQAFDIKLLQSWGVLGTSEILEDVDVKTGMTRILEWTVPISSPFATSKSCRNVQKGTIVAKQDWKSEIRVTFDSQSFDIPVSDCFETRVQILLIPIDGQTILHFACKIEFLKSLPLMQKMLKPIIQSMGTSGLQGLWTQIADRLVARYA